MLKPQVSLRLLAAHLKAWKESCTHWSSSWLSYRWTVIELQFIAAQPDATVCACSCTRHLNDYISCMQLKVQRKRAESDPVAPYSKSFNRTLVGTVYATNEGLGLVNFLTSMPAQSKSCQHSISDSGPAGVRLIETYGLVAGSRLAGRQEGAPLRSWKSMMGHACSTCR